MLKSIILLIILLPASCFAQSVISGRVVSNEDKKPVSNANVFISNASVGGRTLKDGTFTLHNAQPGKYELIVSIIGFETYSQAITISNKDLALPDIFISPKATDLKEINITAASSINRITRDNPNWEVYYAQFKTEFLGTNEIAPECEILNPDMINFRYNADAGTLLASSPDFIEIENRALGYKIKYLLANFTSEHTSTGAKRIAYIGTASFEVLTGTPAQQRRWEQRRIEVYQGSAMHFFRSALQNRLEEEGFRVLRLAIYRNPDKPADSLIAAKIKFYTSIKSKDAVARDSLSFWEKKSKLPETLKKLINFPLSATDVVKPTNQKGSYAFGCDFDELFISYNKNHRFPVINAQWNNLDSPGNLETTLIHFNSPYAFLGIHGGVMGNVNSLGYTGVWGRNRIAMLLPFDYQLPGQNNGDEIKVDSAIAKLMNARLQYFLTKHHLEKAYLHFDKPYYAAGDTLYFKAYVTAGENHVLSPLSGVLHVDLIDASNRVEQAEKLQLVDGVAWGDFALPDSLAGGRYRVRAYTQWMRNEGEGAFFEQTTPIGTTKNAQVAGKVVAATIKQPVPFANPVELDEQKADLQFFPEGGNLVAGIRTKVAFKAIGPNGLGIDVKGVVVDNNGHEIASLASSHLGMGAFYLVAGEGRSYKVKVTYSNGKADMVDLPKPEAKGITLSVNDSLHFVTIRLNANTPYYKEYKDKSFTLLVYSGGEVTPIILRLDSAAVSADIFKNHLHSGIARITLFSPTGEPLSERLLFIRNNDQLKLTINTDKTLYGKRKKVNVLLNATAVNAGPAAGHFSVSVIDENKVPQDENAAGNIFSNLLLTSHLTGYVEQPGYYFTGNSAKTTSDLDLVMLTHGYRHFEWKQLLNGGYPDPVYPAEKGLEIAGTATTLAGKPLANGTVTLVTLHGGPLLTQVTDAKGGFRFMDLVFADTGHFVLQAVNAKGKENTKLIYNPERPIPVGPDLYRLAVQDSVAPIYLQNRKKQTDDEVIYGPINGKLLKEVKIKEKKKDPNDYVSSNIGGPGHADVVLHSEDIENLGPNLDDIIGLKVPGITFQAITITTPTRTVKLPFLNSAMTSFGSPVPMLVVLNGTGLPDGTALDFINPADVETIEVLKYSSSSIWGARGAGGVLVITTKQGRGAKLKDIQTATDILPVTVNGFYSARVFYAPKYEHTITLSNREDLRSTIYWVPELLTDKNGNASFSFYNADGTGNYRVVVEGIDDKGNIGSARYSYKVE